MTHPPDSIFKIRTPSSRVVTLAEDVFDGSVIVRPKGGTKVCMGVAHVFNCCDVVPCRVEKESAERKKRSILGGSPVSGGAVLARLKREAEEGAVSTASKLCTLIMQLERVLQRRTWWERVDFLYNMGFKYIKLSVIFS